MESTNITYLLSKALHPELQDLLFLISKEAKKKNHRVFLVGGLVRDVFLGLEAKDVDILVEGPAIDFVKEIKDNWKERFVNFASPHKVISFPRYGTIKLNFLEEVVSGLRELDFSTAREESYPQAGLAPEVKVSTLLPDLARRDFTVNAIAVEILPSGEFLLFDQHQGLSDLENKSLRILHQKSFLDDPARLIRGMRFKNRFSFAFEKGTEQLFKEAVTNNYLKSLPANRLFDEFKKALKEKQIVRLLKQMDSSGLLQQILPSYDLGKLKQDRSWQQTLFSLSASKDKKEFVKSLEVFNLPLKEIQKIVEAL